MRDSGGTRLDSFPVAAAGGNAAILMQRLTLGVESATVLILGDSTGVVGASPWPLLVARWLAAQFPAYTVNYRVWDDASQTYLALGAATAYPTGLAPQTGSRVVQTGTGTGNAGGPFVLTVYNGSVSGAKADYPRLTIVRWSAMTTVSPQLVLVNYGHNNNGATDGYRATHYLLCRNLQQALPEAGVVQIAQTPRAASDAEKANDLIRARVVMSLAASEGYGLVNATQRFLADPSYATTLLLPDGLHPNDTAGSPAIADEVEKQLALGLRSVPRGPHNRPVEVFLPATAFAVAAGAATLGPVNGGNAGWSLPAGAATEMVSSFVAPEHWSQFDINFLWTYGTGNAAQAVAWHVQIRNEGVGVTDVQTDNAVTAFPGWTNLAASPYYFTKTPGAGSGTYPTMSTQAAAVVPINSRPIGLKLIRRGEVAGVDTYAAPVFLLGARLIRRR